jgi:hypothetical protein
MDNETIKITPEEFAHKFQKFDIGNSNSCLFILNDKLEKGATTFIGEPITIDLIYEKYSEYCLWWKGKFFKSDPKYIAAKDKKKSVYDFLMEGLYNNTYEREELPRDLYLFGNTPKDELIQKTQRFIENARRKQPKSQT